MKTTRELNVIAPYFDAPKMREIEKLMWLWAWLDADVGKLEKPAKKEKETISFHRRQYVRSAAALVEGVASMLKQNGLLNPQSFSPEEILLLQEKEPYLQDNGQAALRARFIKIEANIRFAFMAYAKCHGAVFILDCGGAGWQSLKKLFEVRDRITHPKRHADLAISDAELDSIKQALKFVSDNHSAVQTEIQRTQWLRDGMPEELFKDYMLLQKRMSRAASRGELHEKSKLLQNKLFTKIERYFNKKHGITN